MATILTNDMASVFLQPAGPNSQQYWLGCHDMGDVAAALGDVTRDYCPDPSARGKWKVMSRAQGSASEITADITFPVGKTADYLEEMAARNCPVGLYVNWAECGQRNWENVYDRGFVLEDAVLTGYNFTNVAMAGSDGAAPSRSTRTFSFSSKSMTEYYSLVRTERANAATHALIAIKACSKDQCVGSCGAPGYAGQVLYAVEAAAAATKSILYESVDYGVTWAAQAAFNADVLVDENTGVIACFPMTPTTTRVLMGKTEAVAGAPASVFWTDDGGATYHAIVTVGVTNGEYFPYASSIFALSKENIWACTTDSVGGPGAIYFSNDGGATWALQLTGAANDLNVIHFADENTGVCFGVGGVCYTTIDGGAHWTAKTVVTGAPVVQGGLCLDASRLWAATAGGDLYYSQDGGLTWAVRLLPLPAGAVSLDSLSQMDNLDDYILAVVGAVTVGASQYDVIYRSWDGGMNWTSVVSATATAATSGIGLDLIATNNIFSVGVVAGGAAGLIMQAAMS